MPKFSALSIRDLMTADRNAGRVARRRSYAAITGVKLFAVVCIEADDGSWFEMDADSSIHAQRLADNAVDTLKARGASCWRVLPSGKLARNSIYTRFDIGPDIFEDSAG